MKKTILKASVAAVLLASVPTANAAVNYFNYDGIFTMLDAAGNILKNTSTTTKGANGFQTPVNGTMAFDTVSGAGTATLVPFEFFNGGSPAAAVGIKMQAVGDGLGGAGTLVMGNMLFNWDVTNGIPVSIVLDAAGFFTATGAMWGDGVLDQTDVAATGAIPGSDGTYADATWGYLGLGAAPMATTEWNTTSIAGCGDNDGTCLGNDSSGQFPAVLDTIANPFKYANDDGWPAANQGISGSPMMDGPFPNMSANFDVLTLTATGQSTTTEIAYNCTFALGDSCPETAVAAVPVPAAVWLFGSGLLGLVGVARRKKA